MKQKTASSLLFYFGILTVPIAVLVVVLIIAVGLSVVFSG